MAAEDVAKAVGRVAVGAPVNGIVEVGGPDKVRMDELIRTALAARNDPREVVTDPTRCTSATTRSTTARSSPPTGRSPARSTSRTGSRSSSLRPKETP